MEIWQIILAIIIVVTSIIMPIYYLYKKKKIRSKIKIWKRSNRKRKNKSLFR